MCIIRDEQNKNLYTKKKQPNNNNAGQHGKNNTQNYTDSLGLYSKNASI